jgi:hypothetical protein
MDWRVFDDIKGQDLRLRLARESDFSFVQGTVWHASILAALHETPASARATLKHLWSEGFEAPDMRHFIVQTKGPVAMPTG